MLKKRRIKAIFDLMEHSRTIFLMNQGFALVHAPEWLYAFTSRGFGGGLGQVKEG